MIIGFTGKKFSGKTICADLLQRYASFVPLNFKTPLLKEVEANFDELLKEISSIEQMDFSTLFSKKPPLIRKLLQNYGTDVRRKDDKDYWTKRWDEATHPYTNITVDDVRFLNEAEIVKEKGGIVVRVTRPSIEEEDLHISEVEMEKIIPDFEIANDGTIEDLQEKVKELYKQIESSRLVI